MMGRWSTLLSAVLPSPNFSGFFDGTVAPSRALRMGSIACPLPPSWRYSLAAQDSGVHHN